MPLLFLLLLLLVPMCRATTHYISSLSDVIVFNMTGTPLDATALEVARQACAANTMCAYLAVQNNGPYIGAQQWTYLSTNNPPYTPYPYAETPLLVNSGLTAAQLNALLGVYQTIAVNVVTPSCPIGSTPLWDTATNEQACVSQTDRALEYNIWWYVTLYIFLIIAAFVVAVTLWYLSYIPAYLKNISFRGEVVKKSL